MSRRAKSGERALRVDPEVYPLAAVQAAAYALTDRAHVKIEREASGGELRVLLRAKNGAEPGPLEGDFFNELLHQSLRLRVSAANQKLREYIVTRALVSAQPPSEAPCPECESAQAPAEAPPLDAELEKEIEKLLAAVESEGAGDPLGVVVPWEEKFGKPDDAVVEPVPDESGDDDEPPQQAEARRKAESLVSDPPRPRKDEEPRA